VCVCCSPSILQQRVLERSASGGQPIARVPKLEQAPIPENLWKLGKLNHVAIAVPDLQKSMSLYRNILGAKVSEPEVR
jgi:methylmalonyl-CoA/ethylmalonyl-CoA epimerase